MDVLDRKMLEDKLLPELQEIGQALGIEAVKKFRKKELIDAILQEAGVQPGEEGPAPAGEAAEGQRRPEPEEEPDDGTGSGILDILADGYGFLRTKGYLPSEKDIYVSMSQIRRFRLKRGDEVKGQIRPPKDSEKYNALLRIESVNTDPPEIAQKRRQFEKLTPLYPMDRLKLETRNSSLTSRIIDLIAPVGKGQRGLIVSPPKAGKTTVLKQIANSITENNPEVYMMVLLVDERPEEATDM
jgi:transcription termination factor Rho